MMNNSQLVATTYAGLEEVLAAELLALNADEVQPARRAVYFSGNEEMIYRANYSLRTALKILVPLRTFKIMKADDLYHQAFKIKWEEYFDADKTFAVQSTVFSDLFNNSMFASLKLKDAIVDRFRRAGSKRPSVDTRNPQVQINLHIANNSCTISLDSSGESLHKRGYRVGNHEAPISEVLAAGMLKLAGWNGEQSLFDPMCGSGTIVIEAAMMAKNVLPGEIGRKYAFQHWKNYQSSLFEKIKSETDHRKPDFKLYGSDISRGSVDLAFKNAEKARVNDLIKLEVADFRTSEKKTDCGFLVFNPPYGERIETGDEAFYSMIGERLKHHYPETEAWIISTNDCLKSIGLKPARKIPLFNGALACSFRKYELYKGSRKE
ncbi:THUMP domain-containing class I SAM-dependent RNA methyltransferase [Gaoshiqia sediminis]|uniref:THUMP domain-containing protein n=1 Tax=Gaoshiqia sediminis TaxID=2986998 RepID=A0AA41Y6D2_9BACT|nr:THUMP domain-containing protein [Gaoshiqia sediminis]MCW0481738.1 THUMP domain-containing protein [Gaoshiqia sediminis]